MINPLEPDEEIDYLMLQQLAQLLPPPQPMLQIEGASSRVNIPWQTSHGTDEAQYSMIPRSSASGENTGPVQQNEIRSTFKRLDNLSMRRVETIDTISASSLIAQESVHTSIECLQSMRGHICKAQRFIYPDLSYSCLILPGPILILADLF